jgi:hypothetical protein
MDFDTRRPRSAWDGTPWKIKEARKAYEKVLNLHNLEPLSASPTFQSTPQWPYDPSPKSALRTPVTISASPLEWQGSELSSASFSPSGLSWGASASNLKDPSLPISSYLRHTLTLDSTPSNPWLYHEAPAPHVLRYACSRSNIDYTPMALSKPCSIYRTGGDPAWRHLMFSGLSSRNTKSHQTFARLLVLAHESWPQRDLGWLANDLIQNSINTQYAAHSASIVGFISAIGTGFQERFGGEEVSRTIFANALAHAALQTFLAFWDVTEVCKRLSPGSALLKLDCRAREKQWTP